jgi:hypothetical protein
MSRDSNGEFMVGQWYVEDMAYYLKLIDDPTIDQFRHAFRTMAEAIGEAFAEQGIGVYLLFDVNELRFTANTWSNILNSHMRLNQLPLAKVIVIGQTRNRLMRLMMLKLFEGVHGGVTFVGSLEEAHANLPD